MKYTKYVFSLIFTSLLVFGFVFNANAQRGRGGNGGGRPSGGSYGARLSGGRYSPSRPVFAGRVPSYYPRASYGRIYRPYYGRYNSFYVPRLGFQLSILPFGYRSFYYGPDLFYYHNGIFYRNYNNYYEVVAPPVGAEISVLPQGTSEITINGEQFFEKNGVYYREAITQDGKRVYIVAGKDGELNTGSNSEVLPRVGDIVDELPKDSKSVQINNEQYFISPSGIYYQETTTGGRTAYKVVGSTN